MITVVICTHNPRPDIFKETLEALQQQVGLTLSDWEVLVVDNASNKPVRDSMRECRWENLRVVEEAKVGLTHARLRGLAESAGDIIVFVDDDNVLDSNYLRIVRDLFATEPALGAVGGKSVPRFGAQPPVWFTIGEFSLGCQDLGNEPQRSSWRDIPKDRRAYPSCSPIGGGMAIRREALALYAQELASDASRQLLDRRGRSLASGGDNDIVMCTLEGGYSVGYEPRLTLTHIIPSNRLSQEYLERYQRDSSKTWVQVLHLHGICPWTPVASWTLPLRKLRAYFRTRAWQSDHNRTRWMGACGLFEGRAAISNGRSKFEP